MRNTSGVSSRPILHISRVLKARPTCGRKPRNGWAVEKLYSQYFTKPVVGGNYFAMGWGIDADVAGLGRRKIDEIILYEVKDGEIVMEQFFY